MSPAIRTRAPLRLGLAGGGTDLSPFCDEHGGAVLNCTIDRYAYAFVSARDDGQVVFQARDVGQVERHPTGSSLDTRDGLRLHRCAYNHLLESGRTPFHGGLTLTTVVDAPPGSGLGSSSALVVAICEALHTFGNEPIGLYELAHLAFDLERVKLGMAGGKQDHYAAAFGGLNYIEFLAEDRVIVNPLRIERAILNEFEASLVVCFTGTSRESERIIREQTSRLTAHEADALQAMLDLKQAAADMKAALLAGDIRAIAATLATSWASKKRTAAAVSSAPIDALFETGLRCGALAGKISGAGGGGFMMFLVPPEDRRVLITGLNAAGGNAAPVHLTRRGVESWRTPTRR
jgi:D-glycero-alpha-D-manno-heptose-7-phosphate kinase